MTIGDDGPPSLLPLRMKYNTSSAFLARNASNAASEGCHKTARLTMSDMSTTQDVARHPWGALCCGAIVPRLLQLGRRCEEAYPAAHDDIAGKPIPLVHRHHELLLAVHYAQGIPCHAVPVPPLARAALAYASTALTGACIRGAVGAPVIISACGVARLCRIKMHGSSSYANVAPCTRHP